MELNRLLEIAAERTICDLCSDSGDDACIACHKVKGVTAAELREYHSAVSNALRRTSVYEQLEREGRLVELPCKVGEDTYFVLHDSMAPLGVVVSEPHRITEVGTRGFWTSSCPRDMPDEMGDFTPWSEIGKTVFLTRAEAEAALGGGEGG